MNKKIIISLDNFRYAYYTEYRSIGDTVTGFYEKIFKILESTDTGTYLHWLRELRAQCFLDELPRHIMLPDGSIFETAITGNNGYIVLLNILYFIDRKKVYYLTNNFLMGYRNKNLYIIKSRNNVEFTDRGYFNPDSSFRSFLERYADSIMEGKTFISTEGTLMTPILFIANYQLDSIDNSYFATQNRKCGHGFIHLCKIKVPFPQRIKVYTPRSFSSGWWFAYKTSRFLSEFREITIAKPEYLFKHVMDLKRIERICNYNLATPRRIFSLRYEQSVPVIHKGPIYMRFRPIGSKKSRRTKMHFKDVSEKEEYCYCDDEDECCGYQPPHHIITVETLEQERVEDRKYQRKLIDCQHYLDLIVYVSK